MRATVITLKLAGWLCMLMNKCAFDGRGHVLPDSYNTKFAHNNWSQTHSTPNPNLDVALLRMVGHVHGALNCKRRQLVDEQQQAPTGGVRPLVQTENARHFGLAQPLEGLKGRHDNGRAGSGGFNLAAQRNANARALAPAAAQPFPNFPVIC